jgi:hypothetical protein
MADKTPKAYMLHWEMAPSRLTTSEAILSAGRVAVEVGPSWPWSRCSSRACRVASGRAGRCLRTGAWVSRVWVPPIWGTRSWGWVESMNASWWLAWREWGYWATLPVHLPLDNGLVRIESWRRFPSQVLSTQPTWDWNKGLLWRWGRRLGWDARVGRGHVVAVSSLKQIGSV